MNTIRRTLLCLTTLVLVSGVLHSTGQLPAQRPQQGKKPEQGKEPRPGKKPQQGKKGDEAQTPKKAPEPQPDPKSQPTAKLQPDALERFVAQAAALALSASNGNGGDNTYANLLQADFRYDKNSFLPTKPADDNLGPGKVSYRVVWNDSTVMIGFQGLNQQVHSDMFWDSKEHKKGLSKILGKSGFMVYVPKRFYEAFEAARPTIEKQLQSAGAIGRGADRRKLVITGHSMGGLWSHYLTMALLEKGHRIDTTITFGTPYVARADFQRYLQSLAKEKNTTLIAVENYFDEGIRNWMEKNSKKAVGVAVYTTPAEYQNRIGTQVRFAFRENEHEMSQYFAWAKFRAEANPDPKRTVQVDGTSVTVFPVVEDRQLRDKVQIQLYPKKDSGTWWKALKVVDAGGKAYWLEWESGKFVKPQDKTKPGELWLPRNALEDKLRIEFWKAKEFGIHRYVGDYHVKLLTVGKNRIAISW